MPFCPVCKSEFRAKFERCEECDVALVGELPAPPPAHPEPPNPAFRPVYSTTELADAVLLASLLEGHGIDAEVENQRSGLYVIGFPTSATPVTVTVPEADAHDAVEIIRHALKTRSAPPGHLSITKRMWLVAIAVMTVSFAVVPFAGGPIAWAVGWGALLFVLWIWRRVNREAAREPGS